MDKAAWNTSREEFCAKKKIPSNCKIDGKQLSKLSGLNPGIRVVRKGGEVKTISLFRKVIFF